MDVEHAYTEEWSEKYKGVSPIGIYAGFYFQYTPHVFTSVRTYFSLTHLLKYECKQYNMNIHNNINRCSQRYCT